MKKISKSLISKLIGLMGYEIRRVSDEADRIAVELSSEEVQLIKEVINAELTMTSIPRLVATLKACKYAVNNNIPGDFVECGVWRGGNSILAKKYFEMVGSNKKVYMFDTFGGMTEPTELDTTAGEVESALSKFNQRQKDTHNDWCYASLEEVKNNCQGANVDMSGVKFIKGDVCETLEKSELLPKEISVLRLDTDWYESTKKEMEVLYPLLAQKGVLIIDDYGHWQGSRQAVDEYFSAQEFSPLLNVTDYTGRLAIKC